MSYVKLQIHDVIIFAGPEVHRLFRLTCLLSVFLLPGLVALGSVQTDPSPPRPFFMEQKDVRMTKAFSPAVAAGSCLPLLKSIPLIPSAATVRNQRSAGTAAALGLVLGVRFALGPPRDTTVYTGQKHTGPQTRPDGHGMKEADYHAMVVSAFRACRKEWALSGTG